MAYTKRAQIIARRGYSGMGGIIHGGLSGFWDSVKDFGSSIVGGYNASEQAQGAATQAQADTQRAIVTQGGIGMTDVMLVGGVAAAAYFLLRKKKKA